MIISDIGDVLFVNQLTGLFRWDKISDREEVLIV